MTYRIINPQVILSAMMNSKEMAKQFVEMYLNESPMDFDKLMSSVSQQDTANIRTFAHHIKPTMAYIGAEKLHHKFQELENDARTAHDPSVIAAKFDEIKVDFDQMLEELKAFLQELSS